MKLKRHIFLLLLLLTPLSLFSTEHVTLQLRWFHQFQFAGYYMAQHKGYYKDAGLDVTILEANGAHRHPTLEVLSDRAQYGIGNAGLVAERIEGKPLVVLASFFQTSPSVWIMRKDSGIATVGDLADKKLMMTKNIENTELLALFGAEGIKTEKLNIIESSFDINDLIEKKVDAFNGYSTNEPYYLMEKGIEYNLIEPRKYGVDFYSDSLFTSQKELRKHPERVEAFRQASIKGWEYALAHPDEAIDVILNNYSKTKSKEHLLFEAKAIAELMQSKFVQVGHMNPARWQYVATTYKELGFIKNDTVPDDFIYTPNFQHDHTWLFWALGGALILVVVVGGVALYIYRLNRQIKEQAIRDPLTGLYNRYYLSETLPREMAHAAREHYPISFIMLDLDYFKHVNDTYGHAAGDIVLKTIAATLSATIREDDFVCRFGGEEFLVVMPHIDATQAFKRIDAYRKQIEATPITYASHTISLTISGGIATYDAHGKTQDEVIKAADDALYASKSNGRNQITIAPQKI